jgi:hypothetical protein
LEVRANGTPIADFTSTEVRVSAIPAEVVVLA